MLAPPHRDPDVASQASCHCRLRSQQALPARIPVGRGIAIGRLELIRPIGWIGPKGEYDLAPDGIANRRGAVGLGTVGGYPTTIRTSGGQGITAEAVSLRLRRRVLNRACVGGGVPTAASGPGCAARGWNVSRRFASPHSAYRGNSTRALNAAARCHPARGSARPASTSIVRVIAVIGRSTAGNLTCGKRQWRSRRGWSRFGGVVS